MSYASGSGSLRGPYFFEHVLLGDGSVVLPDGSVFPPELPEASAGSDDAVMLDRTDVHGATMQRLEAEHTGDETPRGDAPRVDGAENTCDDFSFGDVVRLASLQIASELNGREGVVVGYASASSRYEVRLDNDGVRTRAVRRENLTLVAPSCGNTGLRRDACWCAECVCRRGGGSSGPTGGTAADVPMRCESGAQDTSDESNESDAPEGEHDWSFFEDFPWAETSSRARVGTAYIVIPDTLAGKLARTRPAAEPAERRCVACNATKPAGDFRTNLWQIGRACWELLQKVQFPHELFCVRMMRFWNNICSRCAPFESEVRECRECGLHKKHHMFWMRDELCTACALDASQLAACMDHMPKGPTHSPLECELCLRGPDPRSSSVRRCRGRHFVIGQKGLMRCDDVRQDIRPSGVWELYRFRGNRDRCTYCAHWEAFDIDAGRFLLRCQRCCMARAIYYFHVEDGIRREICATCQENHARTLVHCRVCRKEFREGDVQRTDGHTYGVIENNKELNEKWAEHFYARDPSLSDFVCSDCAPERFRLLCSICHTTKALTEFRQDQIRRRQGDIIRCRACAVCNVCGINHIAGFDQLAAGRPYCWTCRKHTCDVCKETLTTEHFSTSQLKHRTDPSRNKDLRCRGCHTCESCDRVKRAEDFRGCDSRCIACLKAATSLCCDACKTHRPAAAFDRDVLHHATYHGRKRVCGACEEQGYSARDVTSYPCSVCGPRGHKAFEKKGAPCCTDCVKTHER